MKRENEYITDFLFSTPNFLSGMGTAINLAGNYYSFNTSVSESEADCKAIEFDFGVIGNDICRAKNSYEK